MLAEYLNSFLSNMNAIARRVASNNNLSLSQYYTLRNIASDGISMGSLSSLVGVDNSTLTRNINVLISRELVDKRRSEYDRREFHVMLSTSGTEITVQLDEQMESQLSSFIADIPVESREAFIEIIEQLNWKMSSYLHGE